MMTEYKLITEIIGRSQSKIWDVAKLEWALNEVYEAEVPETCLCGHFPIIEICVLKNKVNRQSATVGNCCVKKFIGLPSDKIFQAVKRVRKDNTKSYTANKINGTVSLDVAEAINNLDLLKQSVMKLILGLHWKDFELLAGLIFARMGLQRVSELGGMVKDIDLELVAPVTGRRAYVQVKSQADLDTLNESIGVFKSMAGDDDFFFVVHASPATVQQFKSSDSRINVIGVKPGILSTSCR